jgi:citrate lyase subunit beta/citryl-CoA lyase
LHKATGLAADCLILDLEDAVAPEKKNIARAQIINALSKRADNGQEIAVRINALGTPWVEHDALAVATSTADAIVLPKAETATQINALAKLLDSKANRELPIWIMCETPRGVLNIGEIAQHPRVRVIVMGTSDLAKDLRVSPLGDRAGLEYALSSAVLAARAEGLDIIDGVHLALDDDAGFRAACQQGRELGFDGKSLIHPRQIAAANAAFGVTQSAADHAREIVDAWQQARAANEGVTVVRGQLIEQLHVDEAHRILDLHEQMLNKAAGDNTGTQIDET